MLTSRLRRVFIPRAASAVALGVVCWILGWPSHSAAQTPAQVGQWSTVINWPLVPVHAVLLPTGDVLGWSDYTLTDAPRVWNLTTNVFTSVPMNTVNMFCAGNSYLADGRTFVVGGTGSSNDVGIQNGDIYNSTTQTWTQSSLMSYPRYYPTVTALPDGRMLVLGGTTSCPTCIADVPEIYDPVANAWTQFPNSRMAYRYYPHTYVLPDGRIVVTSADDSAQSTRVLNLNSMIWTTVDSRVLDGHSSAMYLPGKIVKAGTATDSDHPGLNASANTYVLDMTQPTPAWQATAPMMFPRSYLTLTILPDGQVLATGGGTTTDPASPSSAVLAAELWSPTSQTWTTLASMQKPREYHSTALLLPDGRVMVAGGGRQTGLHQPDPYDQPNAEIFSPPYLFKGPRPVITLAPSLIQYGAAFSVSTPDAARIASVSLIALGAVTHAFNENQRYVPLSFSQAGGGLNVQGPANSNVAPPGYYMLFLVDATGVPSVAAVMRLPLPADDVQPPTAPSTPNAVASTGAVSLTWGASTDNIGVTGYTIYRSATSGFTPAAGNQIGQSSTTAYTDTSFPAAGTYYYRVTAQDAKGNISAPSGEAPATVTLDTTPPMVSLTAPSAGATVSGTAIITAAASDDVTVAGVQFLLDGANLGSEAPGPGQTYNYTWNTLTATNGPHTLSARARDGAGNTTLATDVGVTVSNSGPSGLVAAYSFSEGSGTTVADASGNGNTATITAATWTTQGRFGSALSFNGTTSVVKAPSSTSLNVSAGMTLEAWIEPTASQSGWRTIMQRQMDAYFLNASNGGGPLLPAGGGTLSGTTQWVSGSTANPVNAWTHVALTYNGAMLTLYVNGNLANSVAAAGSIETNANPLWIGSNTYGESFQGLIDEVRVYNRALSQTEIQTDMITAIQPPAPDTTPPSAPTGLAATAVSSSQINVSWGASTDNVGVTGYRVERCLGSGCSNFAQIATPAGASFSDTGLASGTSYNYRALATDAAGNPSLYSNTATAVTLNPDTTPPSAPSTLTATAASAVQINLSWAASTDDTGVTGYRVERCQGAGCNIFAQVAAPVATSFSDSGLAASTSYSYRVRATDAATNLGGYSPVASATTLTAPDTTPPSAPSGLTASALSTSQIDLTWGASTDNVGVTGYRVERCQGASCTSFAQVGTPVGTSFSNTGLASNTTYRFRVRAADAAGNLSGYSSIVSGKTLAPDTTRPTAPAGLAATPVTSAQINLTWGASTDNVGVTGYRVERCQATNCSNFVQIAAPSVNSFSDTGLTGATTYRYRVRASDAAGNLSTYSNIATALTPVTPDTTPPSMPGGLTATAASSVQISLSWTASTDNVAVTGYRVERCQGAGCSSFAEVAALTGTAFGDGGLTASTSYSYRVRATDAAANFGPYSSTASATTQPPDTIQPSVPGSLTAVPAGSVQINLNWTASTDNVAVTGYRVERCQGAGCSNFAQVAAPAGTSFNDSGLTASTSYSYRVRAADAAGNFSDYSNIGSATTSNVPPGLVAAYSFSEGSGTTVADVSGNGNAGTITGATWTTQGRFGSALSFNGTTSVVKAPSSTSLNVSAAMTLEGWIEPTASQSGWRTILQRQMDAYFLNASNGGGALVPAGGGTLSGTTRWVVGTTANPVNVWTHVALTYDGATLRLYVNGNLVTSAAATGSIETNANPLWIGSNSYGESFQGLIDEVRVYNRALSQLEIQADMVTPLAAQ